MFRKRALNKSATGTRHRIRRQYNAVAERVPLAGVIALMEDREPGSAGRRGEVRCSGIDTNIKITF